jgi:[histone H3]-dimethyl-L-lysine9 demethylase
VTGRELPHKSATIEVDLKSIGESIEENDYDDDFDEFSNSNHEKIHCKPVRHHNIDGKENVFSISRSMSQPTSAMFYKNVPHRWVCENKLLRLLDPLHPENEAFFHEQWQRGQPVLISNLLDHFQRDLWLPQAFSAEFGHNQSDFINCMTGNLVRNREISSFWDGFEAVDKRLMDNDGNTMLLKLKDWPPDSDFKNIMPSRFDDIMKNLPLNIYTNRAGDLNIVKYLPFNFLHPDLGPKG